MCCGAGAMARPKRGRGKVGILFWPDVLLLCCAPRLGRQRGGGRLSVGGWGGWSRCWECGVGGGRACGTRGKAAARPSASGAASPPHHHHAQRIHPTLAPRYHHHARAPVRLAPTHTSLTHSSYRLARVRPGWFVPCPFVAPLPPSPSVEQQEGPGGGSPGVPCPPEPLDKPAAKK